MKITAENLSRFVGGQVEIQERDARRLSWGKIKSISSERGGLNIKIRFVWLVRGEYPSPKRWANVNNNPLPEFTIPCGGLSNLYEIDDGRARIDSPYFAICLVFFPSNGNKLEPAKVEGLLLVE